MSEHRHEQSVPRGALMGAAFLMVATIGVAASARRAHLSEPPPPALPAIEALEIRFEDRPDGSLAVIDAATEREVSDLAPGSNNFIRGVLRGMFRGRKLESLGHEGRFRLAREANGALTLEDEEIGRRVDLDSFGPTNSAAFNDLLVAGRHTP